MLSCAALRYDATAARIRIVVAPLRPVPPPPFSAVRKSSLPKDDNDVGKVHANDSLYVGVYSSQLVVWFFQ